MAMFNLSHSHAIIQGGNYTQVIQHHNQQHTPWDQLQSAAAPSAFHNSDDDFDAPKCHPNTRVAVIRELRDFSLRRGDTGYAKILWLNGAAGAGKSAIARSLCEECPAEVSDTLLASFFFKRSDASRNNHKAFVTTIAYQIFGYVPIENQSLILGVIERDPQVFARSVDAQFQALIMRPLCDLFQNGYFSTIKKFLIVVDGLDECATTVAQVGILKAIQKICNQADSPFIFLIVSRPEPELQTFFRSSSMVPLLHQLRLDNSYHPDVDIERFLVDKLQEVRSTHPFRNSIPRDWPPTQSIQALVDKSSGQFVYASVVVKYVTSTRHQPHKRLDYVVNLCPPKGDLPFAELDALYMHILSSAEGDVDLALRLVGFHDLKKTFTLEDLARLLQSDPDDFLAALSDLYSVLSVHSDSSGEHAIEILHKSFTDFLFDGLRSGKYYVNKTQLRAELAVKCIQYISFEEPTNISRQPPITHCRAIAFLRDHTPACQVINNISFFHDALTSFSLMNAVDIFLPVGNPRISDSGYFFDFIHSFFPEILDQLSSPLGTEYGHLYQSYIGQFRELCNRHPDLFTHPSEYYTADESAIILITLLILCEPPGSQLPQTILVWWVRDLPVNPPSTYPRESEYFDGTPAAFSNLLRDAALQCFKFLKHDINPISVVITLKYLTWALPHAAPSSELNAVCEPQEPFAYTAAQGVDVESDLEILVTAYMKEYRERHAQYLSDENSCIV